MPVCASLSAKTASRPALQVHRDGDSIQVAGTVQPNAGFGDVRVVFLVRCEHRVDIVPSLRRFRRCMRACEPPWSRVRRL